MVESRKGCMLRAESIKNGCSPFYSMTKMGRDGVGRAWVCQGPLRRACFFHIFRFANSFRGQKLLLKEMQIGSTERLQRVSCVSETNGNQRKQENKTNGLWDPKDGKTAGELGHSDTQYQVSEDAMA